MGSKDPTLAYTVHHKGCKYRAGTTADEMGHDIAAELGDHVWEDGALPDKKPLASGNGPAPAPAPAPDPSGAAGFAQAPATAGGSDGAGGDQAPDSTSDTAGRRSGGRGRSGS